MTEKIRGAKMGFKAYNEDKFSKIIIAILLAGAGLVRVSIALLIAAMGYLYNEGWLYLVAIAPLLTLIMGFIHIIR